MQSVFDTLSDSISQVALPKPSRFHHRHPRHRASSNRSDLTEGLLSQAHLWTDSLGVQGESNRIHHRQPRERVTPSSKHRERPSRDLGRSNREPHHSRPSRHIIDEEHVLHQGPLRDAALWASSALGSDQRRSGINEHRSHILHSTKPIKKTGSWLAPLTAHLLDRWPQRCFGLYSQSLGCKGGIYRARVDPHVLLRRPVLTAYQRLRLRA